MDVQLILSCKRCHYKHTRLHLNSSQANLLCHVHYNDHSLDHRARKHRNDNHTQHPQTCLTHTLRRTEPRCSSRTRTRTRTIRRTTSCLFRAWGSSRRLRLLPITKDATRAHASIHETFLQIRNALLDAKAVVSAVAVELLYRCGFAAFIEHVGGVGGYAADAADGAGDVRCGEAGEVGRGAGGGADGWGGGCGG
jgi:hypothetical protein